MLKSYQQRLLRAVLNDGTRQQKDPNYAQKISTWWTFLVTAAAVGIYFLVYWNWVSLPTALLESDETHYPDRFVAEVAQSNLFQLSTVGPRVAGSDVNEVITVGFLRRTAEMIVRYAHPAHQIDIEIQRAYGNMFFDYKDYPQTSVYQGIQNVVVRVLPADGVEPTNYLMLSSHFDSVPQSPGAGDDGTMTVVMLEILRKISLSEHSFRHGIVFVFNGCEENTLQGSHAFMAHHPWFKKVRTFINMDVAANGGRDIMFQAGPKYSFLMSYYRDHVPHPYCTAIAEELFQADLVPSETDYYVYTKFGNIPGMDFAHSSWGYLYHTGYDAFDTIPIETLQHTGDNVLALTRALANAEELLDIEAHEGSKAVFFDFLNWFLIYYPEWAGILINVVVSVVGLALVGVSLWLMSRQLSVPLSVFITQAAISAGVLLLSIIVGVGLSILLGVILNAVGASMSWFTETWLIFGLYICPFLIALTLGPVIYLHFYKNDVLEVQTSVLLFLHAHSIIYIVIVVVLTAMSIRSAYVFTFVMVFYLFTSMINLALQFKKFTWIYIHLAGQIIPIAYFSSVSLTSFATFIPMQGRSNAGSNPELLIALFAVLIGWLIAGFLAPLVSLTRRPFTFIGFIGIFFVTTIIVMTTSVGFPFRAHITPQRYYVFHIERNFYDIDGSLRKYDSKFYIHPQDRHTPDLIIDIVPEMSRATQLGDECERELYCGIPFYQNSYHARRELAWWLPADKPHFPTSVKFRLLRKEQISTNSTTFYFSVSGTDHMSFYVSPVADVTLAAWSFSSKIPRSGKRWNGQDVHYINYVHGIDRSEFEFSITVQRPPVVPSPQIRPSFHLSIVAQYMHHEEYRTDEFKAFIGHFPDYAHVVAYPSYLESWLF